MLRSEGWVRGGFPRWRREPVPWLAAAVVLGVLVPGPWLVVDDHVWSGVLGLLLVAAIAGRQRGASVALVLAAVLLGGALGAPRPPGPAPDALVQGVVRAVRGSSAVVDTPEGSVRLWFPGEAPAVGIHLSARTRTVRPRARLPGAPDAGREDRRTGRPTLRVVEHVVLGVRAEPRPVPERLASARYGGLLWALATGERPGLDPDLVALMRRTGTTHLLAISGLHVGLVAGLGWGCTTLLLRLVAILWSGRRWSQLWVRAAPLPGLVLAGLYADAVGWPVSARRAVVMVAVAALARLIGRPVRPWTALALAALVVVCADPDAVHTLGFGLSFGAVLGILGVTPRLLRWCPPDLPRVLRWTAESLAVTVGAMAGTLPLTAWWFQSMSPAGPLSNLVAGPLVGGVGVPAALVSVYGPELLRGPSVWVGDTAIGLAVVMLQWLDLPSWTPAVGAVGAALLGVALLLRRRIAPVLVCVALVLGRGAPSSGTHLDVTFLSVGQGDAVFVRLPDGRRWLIDGGPPSRQVVEWLRRRGHTHLDAIFLTHPDLDHLGGLVEVVDQLSVGRFVTPRPPRVDEQTYRQVWLRLFERGIPVEDATARLDAPARILHPMAGWRLAAGETRRPRDNDDSLVLLLEHAGRRVLLTGDIERAAENWLAPVLPPVDVIQAPHHGSRTSSSSALVVATRPAWVIISSGRANRFGHPHSATLARWRGRRIARTDRDGTVRVRLTGKGVEVERWRHGNGFEAMLAPSWSPRPLM